MSPKRPRAGRGKHTSSGNVEAVGESYERSVFWSRVMLAAFFTVTVFTLVWAIPWFPYGTSVEDYNSRVGTMALLGAGAALSAFVAVRLRDKVRRVESTYVTMSSVHHRLTDLRRREYFFDRLLIECDRAKHSGRHFVVVVLRTSADGAGGGDLNPVQRVVEVLEPLAKEYDWLAPIGLQEVAMFAPGVSASEGPALARELRHRVELALGETSIAVSAGWAAYGDSLQEAGDLLGEARREVGRADASHVEARAA